MTLYIGLCGEAGAGKDTAGIILKDIFLKDSSYPFKSIMVTSFAAPVYALAEALVNGSLKDRASKEVFQKYDITQQFLECMNEVYCFYQLDQYKDFPDAWNEFFHKSLVEYTHISHNEKAEFALHISPRRLLELVGTEFGREILDTNVWLKVVSDSVKRNDAKLVVVTDVRFDNEALFIRNQNKGMVIEIVAPVNEHATKSTHASAKGINQSLVSHKIINKKNGKEQFIKELENFNCRLVRGLY